MTDQEFIGRFERLEIPGTDFRHADHVRAAWICLRNGGLAEGAARFVAAFRRYVEHLGATGKYHETITWAYLVLINERIARAQGGTWEAFVRNNPDLLDPSMAIVRAKYGDELVNLSWAREVFILPTR